MRLSVYVPITTISPNHWPKNPHERNRAVQTAREFTHLAWVNAKNRAKWKPSLPCVVTMTRVSSGTLDDDNLRGALKPIRDQIAVELGLKLQARRKSKAAPVADDRDPRVTWIYGEQERPAAGEIQAGVRIEVEPGSYAAQVGALWGVQIYEDNLPDAVPDQATPEYLRKIGWLPREAQYRMANGSTILYHEEERDRSPEGGYRASCECVCCKAQREAGGNP